jgi:hypothetical protein
MANVGGLIAPERVAKRALALPTECHGSEYANRSSVDQANRVDIKKKFQTPMSFGLLAGSTL